MSSIRPVPNVSVSLELLELYDQFCEYEAYMAFFCGAMTCISGREDVWPKGASADGVALFAQWLKTRSAELGEELDSVRLRTRENLHS